jgi:hypothetical protein
MISGDNPPKYCRWCGVRMPAPGMHEGSFKSETDCELEAVKSKLDEQVRLREMAESFLRTAIEINEKNTSRLDSRDKKLVEQATELEEQDGEIEHLEASLLRVAQLVSDCHSHAWEETIAEIGRIADSVVERQVLKDGDLVEFEGKRYVLTDVERQLPECRNCGTPSKALTNGWCDGCMGMAIV